MLLTLSQKMQKYNKFVLLFWILVTVSILPFAAQIKDEGTASELEFLPENEATLAMERIQTEFSANPDSSFLIVLNSSDVRADWIRDFERSLVAEFEKEKDNIFGYKELIDIFIVEEQINVGINSTIDDFIESSRDPLITVFNSTGQEVHLLQSGLDQTNQLLNQIVYGTTSLWWNISRTSMYFNNVTNSFVDGLSPENLTLVSDLTFMDTTVATQMYMIANQSVGPTTLGAIMANTNQNDLLSFLLSTSVMNQTMAGIYDPIVNNNTSYQLSLLYNILQTFNATVYNMILQNQLASVVFSQNYHIPTTFDAADISNTVNSQLAVMGMMGNLAVTGAEIMLQTLSTILPEEISVILNTSWNMGLNPNTSLIQDTVISLILNSTDSSEFLNTLLGSLDIDEEMMELLDFSNFEFNMEVFLQSLLSVELTEANLNLLLDNLLGSFDSFIREAIPPVQFPNNYPTQLYENFVDENNRTMLFILTLSEKASSKEVQDSTVVVREIISKILSEFDEDASVYVTGEPALFYDLTMVAYEDLEKTDKITVILVLIVLLIIFLSPITPTIPLVIIGTAISITYSIFRGVTLFTPVPSLVLSLTSVVLLGAGVDYVIFLIARYKEELEKGKTNSEAINLSMVHAGESIISSGMTVALGFGSLAFSSIQILQWMGIGPFVGVLVSLVLALTLTPVIFSFMGKKLLWPRFTLKTKIAKNKEKIRNKLNGINGRKGNGGSKTDSVNKKPKQNKKLLRKIVRSIVDHPYLVVITFLLISAPFVYYGINIQTTYSLTSQIPADQESILGLNMMSESFGPSQAFPVFVLLDFDYEIANETGVFVDEYNIIENFRQELLSMNEIDKIVGVNAPFGDSTPIDISNGDKLSIETAMNYVSDDFTSTYMQIAIRSDPLSDDGIIDIRTIQSQILVIIDSDHELDEVTITLAGFGPLYSDLEQTLNDDLPKLVAILLGSIFIVLFLVLGSIITPIRLELTILLGVFIAMGLTELIFFEIFGFEISWMIPITMFIMVFGLGMDYDIFLVTRIREYKVKGYTEKDAVVEAVVSTFTIISAAGLIMATAFFSLIFSEVVMLKTLGFGIGVAVLIDAILIRLILVPALMVIFDRWNWWAPFGYRKIETKDVDNT